MLLPIPGLIRISIIATIIVLVILVAVADNMRVKEQILNEYLEYSTSQDGKGPIKTYEEFEKDFVLQLNKEKEEESKKWWDEVKKNFWAELYRKDARQNSTGNVPKCPTCGSENISKISVVTKIFFLGPFAPLYKTFKCSNCGYKW